MRKDAQAVVLLVVGAALLKVSLSDAYLRYLRPGLAPVLVVTGLIVLTIGAVTLRQVVAALRWRHQPDDDSPDDDSPDDDSPDDDSPDHALDGGAEDDWAHDGPHDDPGDRRDAPAPELSTMDDAGGRLSWALLAGALAVVLLAPPALGAYQAARTAVLVVGPAAPAPLPPGDPVRLSLGDYVGRAGAANAATLRGRVVTLVGFVVVAADGQRYLARMTISCCAAGARPVEVGLDGNLPDTLSPDEWIEVQGGYVELRDRDPISGAVIPYLEVTSVRSLAAPADPYE